MGGKVPHFTHGPGPKLGPFFLLERDGTISNLREFIAAVLGLTAVFYLSAVETVENVVLSFVPRPCVTAIMATAIPAAIKPY